MGLSPVLEQGSRHNNEVRPRVLFHSLQHAQEADGLCSLALQVHRAVTLPPTALGLAAIRPTKRLYSYTWMHVTSSWRIARFETEQLL